MQEQMTDCIIIGAGPVGLAMASRLQQYGVDCRILDKLEEPVKRTKAAAVWSRTAEIFAQMGLIEPIIDNGLKVYGASFFTGGKRVARLALDTIDSVYNYVLMIAQHETEQVLRENLEQQGTSVQYGSQVSDIKQEEECVKVTLENGTVLNARWLVGCDGAHSFVRHSQGLSFDGQELQTKWIVGDLKVDGLPFDDELLLIMHKEGPTGLFPLGDSLYRVVAELDQSDQDPEVRLPKLVETRVNADNLKVGKVLDAGYFSIQERQVNQYRTGRVFLAGDSAHVQSPIGGQGMNTGIQDADNLAWKLAMVIKSMAGEKLLDTYHEERHPVAEWLVEATSRGTSMITNRQPLVAAFRDQTARLVASLPPVQTKLRNTLAELEINYRETSLSKEPRHVGDGWRFKQGVRAGERAPDGLVLVDGQSQRLASHLTSCQFHLLLFDGGRAAQDLDFAPLLKALKRNHSDFVQPLFIHTVEENAERLPCQALFDHEEELHHRYASVEPSAYLVRPDGYIAYRCKPLDQVELLNYLDEWSAL